MSLTMEEAGPVARDAALARLETPALLLDRERLHANLARMNARARELGVVLRPHMKTLKVRELLPLVLDSHYPRVTVSTLKEAAFYTNAGVTDILYAVGITPNKLPAVLDIIRRGAQLTVVLDSMTAADAVCAAAEALGSGERLPVMIEIDTDGHRAGLKPGDPVIVAVGRRLAAQPRIALRGVMIHAGESYACRGEAIAAMAEQERAGAVAAARALREAGLPAPEVSVGSTPTALRARHLEGVTELRAGVYMAMDLVMAGVGVCAPDDIALSVLATVLGHRPDKGWVLVDAGFLALSRDRGTAGQAVDQGYGLVCDEAGWLLPDLLVTKTFQEHGVVESRGALLDLARFPVGSRLRILPNHACATAAQHEAMLLASGATVLERWPRVNGW